MSDILSLLHKPVYGPGLPTFQPQYVAGVGIDTEKFRQDPAARGEKRRELGFRDSDFLILTVAEMTPNKNHITTLNALARIRDTEEFQNIHYLICGRGEMRESLEKSAARLGIAEHVHFLGYRSDVPELYGCCDLFSFLSFREGLPVALMEAMSSGMGVVCTKIRGNTDLVEDGVSGLFVENQPEAAAAAFLKLYRDPELRSRLGQGAAEKVKMYDEKNVHQRMKDIYLSLK